MGCLSEGVECKPWNKNFMASSLEAIARRGRVECKSSLEQELHGILFKSIETLRGLESFLSLEHILFLTEKEHGVVVCV